LQSKNASACLGAAVAGLRAPANRPIGKTGILHKIPHGESVFGLIFSFGVKFRIKASSAPANQPPRKAQSVL